MLPSWVLLSALVGWCSSIRLGKWKFSLDSAIGMAYGSRFELVRGRLEPRAYRSVEEENAQFHAGKTMTLLLLQCLRAAQCSSRTDRGSLSTVSLPCTCATTLNTGDWLLASTIESGSDNRALVPGAANQKLSSDKIAEMRKDGMSGAVRCWHVSVVSVLRHVALACRRS